MKKSRLLMAALLMMGAGQAWADNVTNDYLTNADFSSGATVTTHVCGYQADIAKDANLYEGAQAVYWAQEVEGWTIAEGNTADGAGGGLFPYGSAYQLKGNSVAAPATNPTDEVLGNALGLFAVWGNSIKYTQTAKKALAPGAYTLSYTYFNQSGTSAVENYIGYTTSTSTSYYAANTTFTVGEWTTVEVKFTLEAEDQGTFSIGYKSKGSGSSANPQIFIDNVRLNYNSYAAAYSEAAFGAAEALDDAAYAAVKGQERTDLKTLVEQNTSGFTDEQFIQGVADIETAVAAFVAAKDSYDALAAEIAYAATIGVSTTDAEAVAASSATTAAGALEATQTLKVLEFTTLSATYPNEVTSLLGEWTSTFDITSGQHWDGTSTTYPDKWSGSAATPSFSQTVTLPAGNYLFKVAGRGQAGVALNMSVKVGEADPITVAFFCTGDTGLGINIKGVTSFDADDAAGFANDNNGRGWQWRYIKFTSDGTTPVTLSLDGTINNSWCSFTAPLLLCDDATFSDTQIIAAKAALLSTIEDAGDENTTFNIGEAPFQIPTSAVTTFTDAIAAAQTVYDNAEATLAEVETATTALTDAITTYQSALNAPDPSSRYYLMVATPDHAKLGNAVLCTLGNTSANNPTGYGFNASTAPADYLAQAVTFTQVSGNTYNISFETAEGTVYLTYGSLNGSAAGWKTQQIQGTTDSEAKGEFQIMASSTTEKAFCIYNTIHNDFIDCQAGGALYTDGNVDLKDFTVAEAAQASVNITIPAENVYATAIFPFTPALPSGVKAYACTGVEGNEVTLEEVVAPAANTPYILEAQSGCASTDLTGWGTAAKASYTAGLLTGVFADQEEAEGYVLQKQGDLVGFYKIVAEAPKTVPAYHAFLTAPVQEARAFFFPQNQATAISTINALTTGKADIFDVNGTRLNSLKKGVNILKTVDGTVRKVMVK